MKEENLRDDLRYYFMSPCEKYRARRHIPWKMGVQILKIIMVTTQVCALGFIVCWERGSTQKELPGTAICNRRHAAKSSVSIHAYTEGPA